MLALCLCLPLTGAEKEKAGYKGRVKSVKHSNFKITEKFGEPVTESFGSVTVAKYDEKGNQLEGSEYDASRKLTSKEIYKCDKKGNKIEWMRCEVKTGFGETRFVPTKETTWEFTYWD